MNLKDQVLDVGVQCLNFLFLFEFGRDGGQRGLVQLETIGDVFQASPLIGKEWESWVSSWLLLSRSESENHSCLPVSCYLTGIWAQELRGCQWWLLSFPAWRSQASSARLNPAGSKETVERWEVKKNSSEVCRKWILLLSHLCRRITTLIMTCILPDDRKSIFYNCSTKLRAKAVLISYWYQISVWYQPEKRKTINSESNQS